MEVQNAKVKFKQISRTRKMNELPREIQLSILNNFVFFYTPSITKQSTYYRHSSTTCLTEEELIENMRSLLALSMTSKQWYELLNHQRMSRLWKSCLCMFTKSTTEVSQKKLSDDETLIASYFKMWCIDEYLVIYQKISADRFVEALSSGNHELCEKLISSEASTKWLVAHKHRIKPYATHRTTALDFIALLLKHDSSFFVKDWRLLEAIIQHNPHDMDQIIDGILMLTKQYGTDFIMHNDEGIELVVAHWASKHCFNVLKPIILEHRKKNPCQRNIYESTYPFGSLIEIRYQKEPAEETLASLQFLVACGVELRTRDTLAMLARVMQLWGNGWKNGSKVVQFLLNEGCGMYLDDKFLPPTIVHYLIESGDELVARVLDTFHNSLGPMLLIKDGNGLLPIQKYTIICTGRRAFSRDSPEQRLKIITALFTKCPAISVYKRCQVREELKKMITITGDDKTPYDKFLKML